jgi:PAS domain S-box-containing protein
MIDQKEYIKENKRKKKNGFENLFSHVNNHISSFSVNPSQKSFEIEAELNSHSQIIDSSSLLSISDLTGNIIFANDKFCRVSKYSREELIGKPHNIIRHPESPSSLFKDMWKSIGRGEIWQGEIKNKSKDNSPYWVFATVVPVIDVNNRPTKYISMHIDITHQKKIEAELKEVKKNIDFGLFENVSYAKHVHNAFLTNEAEIKNAFQKSFLIYKAQKIISGDFYGFYKQNNKSIVVLGDSTGHGVSASYISILLLNILKGTLKNVFKHPSDILQTMHREMHNITHVNEKKEITETADIIICSIDHGNNLLNYSSAKMRGIIIRNGKIIELEKDKCSIGEFSNKVIHLTRHFIKLESKDCIYLFSDGIVDQFGGPDDKKFNYKNLKELLLANCELSMSLQKIAISNVLDDWQGTNEQTDDITLLGLQIE